MCIRGQFPVLITSISSTTMRNVSNLSAHTIHDNAQRPGSESKTVTDQLGMIKPTAVAAHEKQSKTAKTHLYNDNIIIIVVIIRGRVRDGFNFRLPKYSN